MSNMARQQKISTDVVTSAMEKYGLKLEPRHISCEFLKGGSDSDITSDIFLNGAAVRILFCDEWDAMMETKVNFEKHLKR